MTSRITLVLSLLLVTAIAFADGGATDASRPLFLAGTLVLVAISSLCPGPLVPQDRPARIALAALTGFAILTLASGWWSPSPGGWGTAGQLAIAYLALTYSVTRACAAEPATARWLVPGTVLSAAIVVGYGLIARALTDLDYVEPSVVAGGRLFAPVGYWNAMGLLGAMGAVACAGLLTRPHASTALQRLAVAAAPFFGVCIALSYSRMAIAAAAAGALVALLVDGRRGAGRGVITAALAALLGAATTIPFAAVRHGDVIGNGGALWSIVLIATASVMVWLVPRRESPNGDALPVTGRRVLVIALIVVSVTPLAAALATRHDAGQRSFGATAGRLTETASNRAQYWSVGLKSFADRPIGGHGAGSFSVLWLEQRDIDEKVTNAHSLWVETAAELGLAGLALLGLAAYGIVAAVRRSHAVDVAALSGVTGAWVLGATLDWHWQIPAVTGPVLIAVAGLLSSSPPDRAATISD